ncbi:S8 family serine peptidase [uncultured Pontibacter sp.]|uniref:S8 family serine peptidase n=1 Tax=uncultured Pontibacter sp. TaxID=453356 RepID=UPI00262939E9|nr:S8 family serine peptidase [uncultured Pontibacter sp.]
MAQTPQLQDANGSKPVSKAKTAYSAPLFSEADSKAVKAKVAASAATALGSTSFPEYWSDRIYVKLKNGQAGFQTFENKASKPQKAATDFINLTIQRYETTRLTALPTSAKLPSFKNTYEVVLENESKVSQLLLELNMMPEVEYAERVPYYVTSVSPNDPSFVNNGQYAMAKIQAVEAFGIHTGTSKTVLAIVDDAVLSTHPDLAANIDLAKSYDVADKDSNTRPPSSGVNQANPDRFSHGTHCAGIAGAVTNNNVGIASVSNNLVSIIGVKCTTDNTPNTRSIERGTDGIIYAISQGARVVSMSYGGTGFSQTVQNIINEGTANGVVFVAAAGNDNIETKHYPAAYDNVIAVASTDASDLKSSFSNYGTWVDISAPGSGILSTVTANDGTNGAYTSYNGTSMSTPMVAGMVALMLSENPNLTPQAITQILKATADPLEGVAGQSAALAGKLGAGRINAYKAIQAIQGVTNVDAPAAITNLNITRTSQIEVDLAWTAPSVAGAEAATVYDLRYATSPITADNFEAATKAYMYVTPAAAGTAQSITVKGLTPNTNYYFALVAKALYGEKSPLSNIVTTQTQTAPVIQVAPASISLSIDRSNGNTATSQLTIENTGSATLEYKAYAIPLAGPNLLSYDKQQAGPDNSFGFGSSSFNAVTKFEAGARGFNLTHVQNYINNAIAANAEVGVRIYKGGTNPKNATLLTTQTATVLVPAGGSLQTIKLDQPQQLQANETFWVEFIIPAGLGTPQGIDNTGARPGVFFLSSDGGASYGDMQPMAAFLNVAALKMRAINAEWIALSPSTGTLATGASGNTTLDVDASNIVNGTYQAELLFSSNDPVTPTVKKPFTLTVTGGQPAISLQSATADFGTLFVGASRTQKVVVKNTGVAALVINSATVAGGEFTAADFAVTPATPITIQPGTQQEINVKFTPSKKAALSGKLILASNDPNAPTTEVTLTATLVNPPVASVEPTNVSLTIDKDVATTATRKVNIRNAGEAALDYALQVMVDPSQSLGYDAERNADSYLGLNNTTVPFHVAVKFNVTVPKFTLAQVQNYYRSMAATTKDVVVKIYKGGASPSAGTLLLEQTVNAPASANNGSMITVPLQQQQRFVQGDIFWVVFVHTGVTYPQGINTVTPPANTNYYSSNGTTWTAYNTSAFKVRALGAPTWLTTTPVSGTISAANATDVDFNFDVTSLNVGEYTARVIVNSNDPLAPKRTVNVALRIQGMPQPSFNASYTQLITGQSITFNNTSVDADAYEWVFEGAEPATSTDAAPIVKYTTPGKYKVSLIAKNTEKGTQSDPLVKEEYITVANNFCDNLFTPFVGTPTLNPVTGGGYVTGNNTYGDLAKANAYDYARAGAYITGTKIKFGAATAADANATVKVVVWDNAGTNGAPKNIIASKDIKISDIVADVTAERVTDITFAAPVALTDRFYVGVLLNQEAGNEVAINSNTAGDATPHTSWEMWDNGTWATIASGWGLNVSLYIQPSITRTTTPLTAAFNFIEPNKAEVCAGSEVFLSASPATGVARYEWTYEGVDEARVADGKHAYLTYNTPGTYTITLKVYDACNGVATISKTVTVLDRPAKPAITQNGAELTSSVATGNQWYLNGEAIDGATAQVLTVTQSGSYTVKVTNENGCESVVSDEVSVTLTASAKDLDAANGLKVYPNPNTGKFTVSFAVATPDKVKVVLVNSIGKVVFENTQSRASGTHDQQVNLSNLSTGVYILQVHTNGKVLTRKVVVNN